MLKELESLKNVAKKRLEENKKNKNWKTVYELYSCCSYVHENIVKNEKEIVNHVMENEILTIIFKYIIILSARLIKTIKIPKRNWKQHRIKEYRNIMIEHIADYEFREASLQISTTNHTITERRLNSSLRIPKRDEKDALKKLKNIIDSNKRERLKNLWDIYENSEDNYNFLRQIRKEIVPQVVYEIEKELLKEKKRSHKREDKKTIKKIRNTI